jgi:hypothetical protein
MSARSDTDGARRLGCRVHVQTSGEGTSNRLQQREQEQSPQRNGIEDVRAWNGIVDCVKNTEQRQITEMEREQQALQSSRQSAEGIKVFWPAACLLAPLVLSRHWLTAGECRSMQCNNASVFGRLVSFHEYTLRPKIFAPFDFYRSHLTSRLIQNICGNTKIIMIYLKYIR